MTYMGEVRPTENLKNYNFKGHDDDVFFSIVKYF